MGRDFVSRLQPVAYCTIPGWKRIWPSETSERDQLGLIPNLTTRDLWRSRRWARGNDNFVYSSLWDFKSSFTWRKILRHGTFRLYFPSERKVCWGHLSPLKIHRLGRGSKTKTLSPVTSTLTTTPPRRLGSGNSLWTLIWPVLLNFLQSVIITHECGEIVKLYRYYRIIVQDSELMCGNRTVEKNVFCFRVWNNMSGMPEMCIAFSERAVSGDKHVKYCMHPDHKRSYTVSKVTTHCKLWNGEVLVADTFLRTPR
jgi:hypothetical protein